MLPGYQFTRTILFQNWQQITDEYILHFLACSAKQRFATGFNGFDSMRSPGCALHYFDDVAFAKLSADLLMRNISKELFPKLNVLHTMLLNHDPRSNISCSGGNRLVPMAHMQVSQVGKCRCRSQGLYSLSGKTSYCKVSWSLEAARFGFKLFQLLWNLAGTSAALLPRCLSNFRAIRPLQPPISRLREFTIFGGKTSYRLVNRGPGLETWASANP